jgi:putative endonuclease
METENAGRNAHDTGKPYYVYMLRCEGGAIYTGLTTDPERRLSEHLSGSVKGAKYTRSHTPQRFAAMWRAADRSEASKLEYAIKRLRRADKERLIADSSAFLELLSTLDGSYVRESNADS